MTWFIFSLTLRQLIGRRSSLIPMLLALAPVLVATVYRFSTVPREPADFAANVVLMGVTVTTVLPLSSLLLGVSVLGDELEEGTIVYLLTKPLRRWQILVPKIAASALVTAVIVGAAALVAGTIALKGEQGITLPLAFAVASVAGAIAYTTLFVLLSLITSRALIAGLVYVFVWEATVTTLFKGTAYLSVRHYVIGLAHSLAGADASAFNAKVGGSLALILVVAMTVIAGFIANRRLEEIELREST